MYVYVHTYIHTWEVRKETFLLIILVHFVSQERRKSRTLPPRPIQVQMSDTREPINDKEVRSFGKERLDDVTWIRN